MLFSFSLVLFFYFIFLLRSNNVRTSASLPAFSCSNACSYLCSNCYSTAKLCLHIFVLHVSQPQAILFSSLNFQPCLLTLSRLQWSQSQRPWTRKCAQRMKKVPLQLCESRKTFCKNLQCAEATHLKTSIPPLTSSTRNLLNGLIPLKPSSFQTCVKNGPQHSHAKVAGALASPLLADVFRENWWQPRTITIWPQSVFPDAPSSTLMHARHSLMKWLSKTRYAFSSLLSSFTCYFHRLEYLVHCSSHPCLFIDYGVVFWLAWGGGGLRLQCHCLRPLCNQSRNYSYLYPTASLACLYSSAPYRTLGSRD